MLKYIRKGPYEDVAETEAWMARHEDRLQHARHAARRAEPAE